MHVMLVMDDIELWCPTKLLLTAYDHLNLEFTSSVALATFQVFNNHR